ncbi:MAG: hypothetical protein BMS9Abin36_0792 [Gammaproteobacteria bacterium]|nr:MAG: hypothetical protein BMS9Abin36_0792 [Gammaproteobacteria bacterium]
MDAEKLLDRLDCVRQTGDGRWIARCPAHDDRSPSLSIRELEDGRILIHDFGGCAATDVLTAIGLSLSDLYPDKLSHHIPKARDRKHFHAAREALETLHREVLIVAIASEMIADGEPLVDTDRERLLEAAGHIRRTVEVCK